LISGVFRTSETPGLLSYLADKNGASGKHSFINMSTRKHYAGKHQISIIINGIEIASLDLKENVSSQG